VTDLEPILDGVVPPRTVVIPRHGGVEVQLRVSMPEPVEGVVEVTYTPIGGGPDLVIGSFPVVVVTDDAEEGNVPWRRIGLNTDALPSGVVVTPGGAGRFTLSYQAVPE